MPLVILLMIIMAAPVSAAKKKGKDPNRITTWNKVTDYFATVGKDKREKHSILRRRKINRRNNRLKKAREKAQEEQRKRAAQYKSSYISN